MRPEQGYTIEVQQMGILPKKLWLRVLLGLGGVFIVLIVVLALV